MLDIGFSELLLIAVVAIIFVKPEDLPVILRKVIKFWRELRGLSHNIRMQMQQVIDDTGLDDLYRDLHNSTIIDLEGKAQPAYDVEELKKLAAPVAAKPPVDTP